jgi:hypothetical protein
MSRGCSPTETGGSVFLALPVERNEQLFCALDLPGKKGEMYSDESENESHTVS